MHTAYNVLSGPSGTVQDFFFASFVTCSDIKASLHRAFKVCEPRKSTHTLQPEFIPSFLPSRRHKYGYRLREDTHPHHGHIRFTACRRLVPRPRTLQVWEDLNQHIKFIDVTEECRRLYGRVQSNCSLLEVWV